MFQAYTAYVTIITQIWDSAPLHFRSRFGKTLGKAIWDTGWSVRLDLGQPSSDPTDMKLTGWPSFSHSWGKLPSRPATCCCLHICLFLYLLEVVSLIVVAPPSLSSSHLLQEGINSTEKQQPMAEALGLAMGPILGYSSVWELSDIPAPSLTDQ